MKLVTIPDQILKKRLAPIAEITPGIVQLIADMKETMKAENGVGLAANQIGRDLALFVIDEETAREHNMPSVYINPALEIYSKDTMSLEEGCLSIPETWLVVPRAKKVKVKALDENGNKIKLIAKGIAARILQHEYDHLQGILITDRVQK